jgi:hypothetical protein
MGVQLWVAWVYHPLLVHSYHTHDVWAVYSSGVHEPVLRRLGVGAVASGGLVNSTPCTPAARRLVCRHAPAEAAGVWPVRADKGAPARGPWRRYRGGVRGTWPATPPLLQPTTASSSIR